MFTPVVISTWSSTPDICIEDYSLDGDEGGGADDEDNIAYKKIVDSIKESKGADQSVSAFKFSQSQPASVKSSWKVLTWNHNLFVHISQSGSSFSKECFISLLDYAEETLHCHYAFLLLSRSINDLHLKTLMQNFRFMGFELLPLEPHVLPFTCPEYIFMSYHMDTDEDDD